jgi:hypothetical protein
VCLRIFSIGVISAAATPETLSFCLNIPKPFAEHSSKAAFTASCSSLRTSLCLPYPIQFLSLSQTLLLRTGKSSQWTILTSGTSSSGFYQLASQLRIALAPPKLDTSSFEREQLCLPMEYTEFTMVDSSRYQLVSSLYGPGTVVCWYLTWVSVQVSWITHPKKGTFDSIDPDFIAVLTLPTVAAGHLISQIHSYPGVLSEMMTTQDPRLLQHVAAIEASLDITDTFMAMVVVLFLLAIRFKRIKRAVLSGATGLFCFSAEVYIFVCKVGVKRGFGNFTKFYLIHFHGIFVLTLFLLSFLMLLGVLGFVFLCYQQ